MTRFFRLLTLLALAGPMLVGGVVSAQEGAAMPSPPVRAVGAAPPADSTAPAPADVTTPVVAPAAAPNRPTDIAGAEAFRHELGALRTALQADIAAVRPAWWERLVPAGIGLLGVFIGGLLGWLQQGRQLELSARLQQQQLRENERIGRAKAGHESLSKVVEYQSKQVNEFYSPLRLMLRRSSGIRRQLTDQLHAKDVQRYVYVREEDGRDHLFVAAPSGEKARFRLIEHMHELATDHRELMPLVREIVSIGVAMTTLIDAKGGLALDSDRLTPLLGRYLAHLSILRDVADKAEKSPQLLAVLRYNVAYPIELDAALDDDMKSLTDAIDAWKALSREMWDEANQHAAANPAGHHA